MSDSQQVIVRSGIDGFVSQMRGKFDEKQRTFKPCFMFRTCGKCQLCARSLFEGRALVTLFAVKWPAIILRRTSAFL
jgi:hypothetical protein